MPVITVRIKYHKVSITYSFPFCCWRRGSGLDVMTSAQLFTGTTFVLIVLIRSVCCRRWKAKDVLLAGSFWLAAKTDGPITGNITGSFCIFLLANTSWPSYRHIARSISNKNKHWLIDWLIVMLLVTMQHRMPVHGEPRTLLFLNICNSWWHRVGQ